MGYSILGLNEEEYETVLNTPLTTDWISRPEWYSTFRKWAEATGESHALWLGDLFYIQMQIDVAKDPSATALWRDYLLYLPTDGTIPETAMADLEKLAQGEAIDRSVGELLNEMSEFMIYDVTATLTHTYVFGPFSEAIADYKDALGYGDDDSQAGSESESEAVAEDDGHYGLSALRDEDDGHYGLSALPPEPSDVVELAPIDQVVDFDTIQEENQRALKEAQEPGTRLPFWQFGAWILLGPGHDPASYQHLLDRGAASGYVTVVSRANNLRRTPGLIQVQGSNDPHAFAETIGRFSNKRVEFV
jgi:hypothetical protein